MGDMLSSPVKEKSFESGENNIVNIILYTLIIHYSLNTL